MRSTSRLVAGGSLGLTLALAGCHGHGAYTGAFKEEAELRMAGIKAATEYDMALQQFLSGDLEKSLKTVESSIALNGTVARSHVLRGRILIELSRLESAVESLDAAIEADDAFADAHYYKGLIHERFSDPAAALACYEDAAAADPTSAQYAVARAEMLIELDRLDDAESLLQQGKDRFRHNAGVRQMLGHIAMMRGSTAEAVEHFRDACLLAPDEPHLIEDLARAQLALNEPSEALGTLALILARDGADADRPDLLHLRAQALLMLDRPVEAREVLRSLTVRPGGEADVQAWIGLANASLILRDWAGLKQAAQRIITAAPGSPDGYMFLALHQRETGRADDAVASLTAAVERVKHPAAPALLRAVILDELGRRAEALASVGVALEHDPGNAEAMRLGQRLGMALVEAPIE